MIQLILNLTGIASNIAVVITLGITVRSMKK